MFGLNNPRQMSFGPDGALYLAEAGKGKLDATDQSGKCATGPEGPSCAGNTGSIIRILHPRHNPEASRIVKRLLSFAGPDGTGATGIDAVSLQGWTHLRDHDPWRSDQPADDAWPARTASCSGSAASTAR